MSNVPSNISIWIKDLELFWDGATTQYKKVIKSYITTTDYSTYSAISTIEDWLMNNDENEKMKPRTLPKMVKIDTEDLEKFIETSEIGDFLDSIVVTKPKTLLRYTVIEALIGMSLQCLIKSLIRLEDYFLDRETDDDLKYYVDFMNRRKLGHLAMYSYDQLTEEQYEKVKSVLPSFRMYRLLRNVNRKNITNEAEILVSIGKKIRDILLETGEIDASDHKSMENMQRRFYRTSIVKSKGKEIVKTIFSEFMKSEDMHLNQAAPITQVISQLNGTGDFKVSSLLQGLPYVIRNNTQIHPLTYLIIIGNSEPFRMKTYLNMFNYY